MKIFKKILIANRGEIAVRIMKTAAKLNVKTVAVYAENDSDSMHVEMADESYSIGDGALQDTYLNIDKIIAIAKRAECDAIHPGYGFLSENSRFVLACNNANIVFIGPDAESMRLMGDKIRARDIADKAGVPISKGLTGSSLDILEHIGEISFPVLVKASAGGGGKGMRIVHTAAELPSALEATSREASTYFGDGTVYVEKFLEDPRHIEIQILADQFGNAVYLFERECSIQRRYQKIIEEAPSPTLTPELRHKMGMAAVELVKGIAYRNAGTIEFLVDKNMQFYFLEMNTRIQVEHPVTELITVIDIVQEQLFIAAGNQLRFSQADLNISGHAIECRIYAENPEQNFLPSPGKLSLYVEPKGENIRIDAALNKAVEIRSQYDPMIAKLVVWGEDRENAIRRMNFALRNFKIQGIKTNIPYLIKLVENKQYQANEISTKFCDNYTDHIITEIKSEKDGFGYYIPFMVYWIYTTTKKSSIDNQQSVWKHVGYWRNLMHARLIFDNLEINALFSVINQKEYDFAFDNQIFKIILNKWLANKFEFTINGEYYSACVSEDHNGHGYVSMNGLIYTFTRNDRLFDNLSFADFMSISGKNSDRIVSPMPGKIIKINVNQGDMVTKGQVLLIVEAMKMENSITAPFDGTIEKLMVSLNEMTDGVKELVKIAKTED
jgi:acetyl-CoA carboxylase biotin carboxylase subunit